MKELEVAILAAGPSIARELAVNALALSQRRIQKEGITGRSYSTRPMLATLSQFNRKDRFKPTEIESTQLGRDANGRLIRGGIRRAGSGKVDRRGIEKKKRIMWIKFPKASKAVPVMVLPGGYKQLRQLNGLQVAFVDLTYTGRMWQNIKVTKETKDGTARFLAVIGATDDLEKKKLAGNEKRMGPFLDPIPEEITVLSSIQNNRIISIIKKVFG